MKVNQISALLNAVATQALGESALVSTDLTGLVALGDTVLSSDTTKDRFLDTLVDRIGKTILSVRNYNRDDDGIIFDTFTYGALLQKIYVKPMQAQNAPQWDLQAGQSVDQYIITKPEVTQKLFGDLNTWEVAVTIPDIQLRTAFTSPEGMAAFIDAIFASVQNSLEMQLENLANTAYANFIGEKIAYAATAGASGVQVVNLLADYNTATGGALTVAQSMRDYEFLQYATREINLYLKRMRKMSTLFNTESYVRHTPTEYARVTILQDLAASAASYLRASTYHDELVSLPYYREIPYWLGTGEKYDFTDVSTINITTSSGKTVNQSGVVALISDIEAVACMCDMRRTKSSYNARGEYTNYFYKADMRYFNDMSENGIVFIVAPTAG